VFGGGLQVTTTIDLRLQQVAQLAISKWLTHPGGPSAALVAIDPRNGEVKAMIGGDNFRKSQFNLAVQGERQPGSSFKPFVLATALEDGISPVTEFESKPVEIFTGDRIWVVHNYEGSYIGRANLTTATTYSDNSIYAQLTDLVGPASVVKTAHAMGITSPLKDYLSIGLGAQAVNPLEMARAFSAFANGGYRIDGGITGNHARAIVSIGGHASGGCSGENKAEANRAINPTTAQTVNSILQHVVTEGTGKRAQLADGRQVAGKTGTTENYGDAWFVGYTPQLVTAVWVGYPNGLRPMLTEYHGRAVAGGTFPAQIWKSFMESALTELRSAPEAFASPPYLSVVSRRVAYRDGRTELDNGHCRDTTLVVYFSGRGPGKTANCRLHEVDVPNVVGWRLSAARTRLEAQPLTPQLIYKPAAPGQRVDTVLRQFPAAGSLSSFDKVTLVLAKPLHGVVPRIVGLSLPAARAKLFRLKLLPAVRFGAAAKHAPANAKLKAQPSRVVSQVPRAGVAAAPGMKVRLLVTRGTAG